MSLVLQVMGLGLLLILLVFVSAKLSATKAFLLQRPTASSDGLLRILARKVSLVAYGMLFIVLSRDKVTSGDLSRARAAESEQEDTGEERSIRIIFIRHGESVWNYVFNRGFGPSFLYRLLRVVLNEMCARCFLAVELPRCPAALLPRWPAALWPR